jgi:hypothetical protein
MKVNQEGEGKLVIDGGLLLILNSVDHFPLSTSQFSQFTYRYTDSIRGIQHSAQNTLVLLQFYF